MKTVGNCSRGRSQGVPKIFRVPMYMAHCAVIFAIAQLSCFTCDRSFSKCNTYLLAECLAEICKRRFGTTVDGRPCFGVYATRILVNAGGGKRPSIGRPDSRSSAKQVRRASIRPPCRHKSASSHAVMRHVVTTATTQLQLLQLPRTS